MTRFQLATNSDHNMMSRKEPNGRREILRHPMTLVLVTFLLSGVFVTNLSNWLANQMKEAEQSRALSKSRKAAVQSLSRYIYERRARAEMLASAFRRKAQLDEIKQRKRLYDDTYVKWNSNHQANLFLIRDILHEEDYSYFESVMEFTLVRKIFKPLDGCLTRAYDAAITGEDPVLIINDCQGRRLLQEALDCGYAVTNELYKLSSGVGERANAVIEIQRRCPN